MFLRSCRSFVSELAVGNAVDLPGMVLGDDTVYCRCLWDLTWPDAVPDEPS